MATQVDSAPGAAAVLRSLVMPIYLPALLVQSGTAMLIPILPLYLRSIDRSYSEIAVILAAAGVGAMLAQLPIGTLLGHRSEASVMAAAVAVMAVASAALGLLDVTIALIAARCAWGAGSTGWLLSRQTLMTRAAPIEVRGRAMSLFGGTTRLGYLIGPVVGGFAVQRFGFRFGFVLAAGFTASGLLPLLRSRRGKHRAPGPIPTHLGSAASSLRTTLTDHWRVLVPMGTAQVLIIAVRQGRLFVIPLIGAGLGLDPGSIGLLVGIGTFTDFVLFPIAGYTMDRFGRLAAVVPAFSLMGIGLVWLSSVDSYVGVAGAAALIGVGNSFGSGTMLTLSSDIAPVEAPSQFLGALGAIRDLGQIIGPVVVGLLADAFGLGAAAFALGMAAFAAVAIFVFVVGETGSTGRVPAT